MCFATDSEECEEAYGELLSLYDARKQQSSPQQSVSAGDGMPSFNTARTKEHSDTHMYKIRLSSIRHSCVLSFSHHQSRSATVGTQTVH